MKNMTNLHMRELNSGDRGSGRTTKQILLAPKDAIFLVHTRPMKDYAENLMRLNKREDLKVMLVDDILHNPYKLSGLNRKLVVDHAVIEWLYGWKDKTNYYKLNEIELQHNARIGN